MTELTPVFYMIIGLVLRIGIPVGVTLLLGWYVHRLDSRWQAEGKEFQESLIEVKKPESIRPCWEYMKCHPDIRDNCPVYGKLEITCWEYFRSNGTIRSNCQVCIYRQTVLSKRESPA